MKLAFNEFNRMDKQPSEEVRRVLLWTRETDNYSLERGEFLIAERHYKQQDKWVILDDEGYPEFIGEDGGVFSQLLGDGRVAEPDNYGWLELELKSYVYPVEMDDY